MASRQRRRRHYMGERREARYGKLEILQHPESEQALEELTEEEFQRQERRGFLGRVFNAPYRLVRGVAIPATIGAVWGTFTGDTEAIKEGAYYGATLGVTLRGLTYLVSSAKRHWSNRPELTIAGRKERITKKFKAALWGESNPKSVFFGAVAIGTTVYFGISLGIDAIMPTDDIFNIVKVDNGLAARIGFVEGIILGLAGLRSTRRQYSAVGRRIHELSGVIDGQDYTVTDSQRPEPRDYDSLPPGSS